MNCRTFERQVADWLGNRLAPEQSRRMEAHRQTCVPCAQTVRAETLLRESWRAASATRPVRDAWPSLVLHLDAPGRQVARDWGRHQSSRWALSGAAVLVIGLVCTWGGRPLGTPYPHPPLGRTVAVPAGGLVVSAAALSALDDVGQVNPAVDDPAGTNMEDVWAQINTNDKAGGR